MASLRRFPSDELSSTPDERAYLLGNDSVKLKNITAKAKRSYDEEEQQLFLVPNPHHLLQVTSTLTLIASCIILGLAFAFTPLLSSSTLSAGFSLGSTLLAIVMGLVVLNSLLSTSLAQRAGHSSCFGFCPNSCSSFQRAFLVFNLVVTLVLFLFVMVLVLGLVMLWSPLKSILKNRFQIELGTLSSEIFGSCLFFLLLLMIGCIYGILRILACNGNQMRRCVILVCCIFFCACGSALTALNLHISSVATDFLSTIWVARGLAGTGIVTMSLGVFGGLMTIPANCHPYSFVPFKLFLGTLVVDALLLTFFSTRMIEVERTFFSDSKIIEQLSGARLQDMRALFIASWSVGYSALFLVLLLAFAVSRHIWKK